MRARSSGVEQIGPEGPLRVEVGTDLGCLRVQLKMGVKVGSTLRTDRGVSSEPTMVLAAQGADLDKKQGG